MPRSPVLRHGERANIMSITLFVTSEHKDALGPKRLKKFCSGGGTIGRADTNDWTLPDPTRIISSRHARIDMDDDNYLLVDTSKNGVFVNGADRPIGNRDAHHLVNGDRLKIGAYEIMVSIEDDDDDDDPAPGGAYTSVLQTDATVAEGREKPPAKNARKKSAQIDVPQTGQEPPETRSSGKKEPDSVLAKSFLKGLGVQPELMPEDTEAEFMELCGQLFRESIEGLRECLKQRADEKERFRLSQTTIQPGENNPLKFSATTDEALKIMIFDQSPGYLPPVETIRDGFRGIGMHREAMHHAMQTALDDFLDRLAPGELKKEFDENLDSGILKTGNKSKYWDCYREMYSALNQRTGSNLPLRFSEVFINAYNEFLEEQGAR